MSDNIKQLREWRNAGPTKLLNNNGTIQNIYLIQQNGITLIFYDKKRHEEERDCWCSNLTIY